MRPQAYAFSQISIPKLSFILFLWNPDNPRRSSKPHGINSKYPSIEILRVRYHFIYSKNVLLNLLLNKSGQTARFHTIFKMGVQKYEVDSQNPK